MARFSSGSWRFVAAAVAVVVTAAGAAPTTVTLDFEAVANRQLVGDFYGGGAGDPSKDYGITFGTSAIGGVDTDAGGSFYFGNVPSGNTTVNLQGDESQSFVTVLGGFTGLSFQYTSAKDMSVTLYDGPNMTGTVLGNTSLPATGLCFNCGEPTGVYGLWKNVTVPFSGVAKSFGFSTDREDMGRFVLVDDIVITLAPPLTSAPTTAPTKLPTKTLTKLPTKKRTMAPTNACRGGGKGMKGSNMKRCMMMKKKPKDV